MYGLIYISFCFSQITTIPAMEREHVFQQLNAHHPFAKAAPNVTLDITALAFVVMQF